MNFDIQELFLHKTAEGEGIVPPSVHSIWSIIGCNDQQTALGCFLQFNLKYICVNFVFLIRAK